MGRPGLLEYGVYGLVIAGTAAWVYGLPPLAHDPDSPRFADGDRIVATSSSNSAELAETETVTEAKTEAKIQTEARDEPARVEGEPAAATEREPSQTAAADTAEPDEQPRLDPQPNLLRVTATRLNMRSEPNANSALVGSYPRGALVEELTTSGNWVLVRTVEDESMGWMWAGYLDTASDN